MLFTQSQIFWSTECKSHGNVTVCTEVSESHWGQVMCGRVRFPAWSSRVPMKLWRGNLSCSGDSSIPNMLGMWAIWGEICQNWEVIQETGHVYFREKTRGMCYPSPLSPDDAALSSRYWARSCKVPCTFPAMFKSCLVQSFLPRPSFLPSGTVITMLYHCIIEVCHLVFEFYRVSWWLGTVYS